MNHDKMKAAQLSLQQAVLTNPKWYIKFIPKAFY
jgi:hypothetical protein